MILKKQLLLPNIFGKVFNVITKQLEVPYFTVKKQHGFVNISLAAIKKKRHKTSWTMSIGQITPKSRCLYSAPEKLNRLQVKTTAKTKMLQKQTKHNELNEMQQK